MASDADISPRTLARARALAKVTVDRDDNVRGRPSTWRIEKDGPE